MSTLENLMLELLPHGSGINDKWELEVNSMYEGVRNAEWIEEYYNLPFELLCHNTFSVMNDAGYYDGHIPFSVVIPIQRRHEVYCSGFRVVLRGEQDSTIIENYWDMILDYLEETIHMALNCCIEVNEEGYPDMLDRVAKIAWSR